ncbi:hypothetical protein Bca52824_090057 [Brassica carinata]|uniref:Inhibitor I9 domain-containing protein n=1 Tax=Brassica carinata TaxID=52824 RepID=A0A8X7NU99_BRACI|nr:hypothetical protein Bca52824_090057 [Brassica carinata]
MFVYIAYMGALPSKASYTSTSHNHNILQEVIKSSSVEDSLVRNYGRSFNGFAAKLSESERDKLIGMEGVVSVFPCTVYKLLTTSSYEFLGLGDKSKQVPEVQTNTIVGVIDGGIWLNPKKNEKELALEELISHAISTTDRKFVTDVVDGDGNTTIHIRTDFMFFIQLVYECDCPNH